MSLLRGQGAGNSPAPHDDAAWSLIVTEAEEQGLTFILYRWLRESGITSQLPTPLLDAVQASVFGLAARNLILTQELAAILRACQTRNLDCLPLRGLALVEGLGGESMDRPMRDIDLLVRWDTLSAVTEVLTSMGYREIDRRPGFARTFSYTLEFFTEQNGGILIEPHWTIAYPPFAQRVDMAKVWRRCRSGRVAGIGTYLLGPTDLLLHLCFHLIHKGANVPLLWYYELHCLIRRQAASLDWPEIVLVAHQTGQSLFLAEVLSNLRRLFDSSIPPSVLTLLTATTLLDERTPIQSGLEGRLVRLLARNHRVDGRESLAQLLTIKSLRARLRFAFSLLFPSSAFMRFHYGLSSRRQLALGYAGRLLFLASEGMKGIASLFSSTRKPLPSSSH